MTIINSIIDIHSHVLPQIDDGSDSVEMSLAMLQKEAEQGIEHVVATPHFYASHDTPDNFLLRREEAAKHLNEAVAGNTKLPKIHLGAEVAYFRGMSESDALQNLRLGDSRYIMVELPMRRWDDDVYRELSRIYQRQNLTPVVAHIERYLSRFTAERIISAMEELPVLLQVNASFFLQKNTARMALRLLKNERIHLLGSDCHNMDGRSPQLGEAVQEIRRHLGKDALEWIKYNQRMIFPEI